MVRPKASPAFVVGSWITDLSLKWQSLHAHTRMDNRPWRVRAPVEPLRWEFSGGRVRHRIRHHHHHHHHHHRLSDPTIGNTAWTHPIYRAEDLVGVLLLRFDTASRMFSVASKGSFFTAAVSDESACALVIHWVPNQEKRFHLSDK